MPRLEPERLLDDLDPEQREAVVATSGPVAILAGAGTGKTRVISRRTAYAIGTDVVPPDQVLVVTFTDKAAGEMVERLRSLGLPGVTARTFHAHALSQLRHFWPSRHDGAPLPQLLDSKIPILGRLARQLPGHFRFTPAKDLADEIEWAKSRRIGPREYEREVARVAPGREPPIPVDLFVRTFDNYERAKARQGRIDFDDLLVETVRLLEDDADAADTIRARKRWFSVDEYQDTSPLQQRLLELWLGDRPDVCVVGDVDQTIYSFTGASSDYLTTFADRHAGARVLDLTRNYRSTPQVLELANRLIAADGRSKRLSTDRDAGPEPTITKFASAEAEEDGMVAEIRELIARRHRARRDRGARPDERPDRTDRGRADRGRHRVPGARRSGSTTGPRSRRRSRACGGRDSTRPGSRCSSAVRRRWADEVGFEEDGATVEGREAQERQSSLETLLAIVTSVVQATPSARCRECPRGAGRPRRPRARQRRRRRQPPDLPPREGPRVGRGLPADARGGLAADPPGARRRRGPRRGATPPLRRHHACPRPPGAVVGATAGDPRPRRRVASRAGSCSTSAAPRRIRDLGGPPVPRVRAPRPGDDGDPVFAALREWRAGIARDEGMPAYVIAHDATLAAIAEARPASLSALRRVKGMGPAKLEKYGDGILDVLASVPEPSAGP